MGRRAAFVPCSHFVCFFPHCKTWIKLILFCSKEKHIYYVELILWVCIYVRVQCSRFEFVLHSSNSDAPVAAVVCCFCRLHRCCSLFAVGDTFISREISPLLYVSYKKKKSTKKQLILPNDNYHNLQVVCRGEGRIFLSLRGRTSAKKYIWDATDFFFFCRCLLKGVCIYLYEAT